MDKKDKRRYVVKRIENRYGCGKVEITFDIWRLRKDGAEHMAECVKRTHAVMLARLLNAGVVR